MQGLLHQGPPAMEIHEEGQRASLASKETKARWTRGQIASSTPPQKRLVGCQVSEPLSHWGLPRVKSLSSHSDISITASSTVAKALLSVFCKGLFKNVETNIPQELNISPRGEEKSYKNIYHSAQGQGRGKSETEQGSRKEDGREDGSHGRTRPSGKGRTREAWGERNSRRGEITRRETVVQDRSGKRENSGRGKTTGEGKQQEKRSREPAVGEGRGPPSMILPR